MNCKEFSQRHAEYLDGLLSDAGRERVEAHLAGCASCRRQAEALATGLDAWRKLPRISVSQDFGDRLRHRLFHEDDASRRRPAARYLGRAAMVAGAAAGLFALGASSRDQSFSAGVHPPPPTVEAPRAANDEREPEPPEEGPRLPAQFLVPFAPALDDGEGRFNATYDMTITEGDSVLLPVAPRTGQLDESR